MKKFGKNRSKRMTEEDLKSILKNPAVKINNSSIVSNKTFSELIEEKNTVKKNKKSTGLDIRNKIIPALKTATITIDASNKKGEEFLSLWFEGARALTLNEILRTSEGRKYDLFAYKKEWQNLINKSLLLLPHNKRVSFDSPCKITLFRQGVKLVDLDGFQAIFKYAIDALRYAEILSEDNPNIMYQTEAIQKKGKPYIIGIKIEKLNNLKINNDRNVFSEWFEKDIQSFSF